MKNFFSFLLIFLSIISMKGSMISYSKEVSENKELNWCYVPTKKGETPDFPEESSSFLSDYNTYSIGDTNNKVLYLTFDEGYENGNTSIILDILKETQVPAAFFVVKPYIIREPELIKRMVLEGHLVCNHSSHHLSMASITDIEEFNKEITDVETEYKSLIGEDMPKFFRPPMGKYSKASLEKTNNLGYKTIFWSFAYKDWFVDNQPDESKSIKKIKKGAHPGAIILLHAVSDTNAKILKEVITDLKDEGYEFKSLNDL